MQSVLVRGSFVGLLGAAALLVGCGGGGGGGSTFTPPSIPDTPIAIDSNNQYEVADAAENGVSGAVDGGGGVLGAVVSGGGSSFSAFDVAELTLLKYASSAAEASQSVPAGISVNFTEPCDSGSIRISANVADSSGNVLAAGDTFSMAFNSCVDNIDGSTVNGSISFRVISGSLDTNAFSITSPVEISVSFNNYQNTEGGQTDVVHGGFNMLTDGATETLSGDSLYVLESGGEAAHLTNFNITNTTADTTTDTITVNLTIASTDINGAITVQTAAGAPLVQGMFDQHPTSGTLIITGNTTTLTMVVLSSTQVSLSLDSDSDGTPDAGYPVTVTWTEVDNGAATVL